MKFYQLIPLLGQPVHVNPAHVVSVQYSPASPTSPAQSAGTLVTLSTGKTVLAHGSVHDILAGLEAASLG